MKLEHLKLENFRGFSSFEISFDPQFTVLLGENMAGKTAVLDGAAVALGALLESISRPLEGIPFRDINDDEIHQIVSNIDGIPDLKRQLPVKVIAQARIRSSDESSLWWKRTRKAKDTLTVGDRKITNALADAIGLDPPHSLPVIAKYGIRRNWRGGEETHERRGVGSRDEGYTGCFDIASTHAMFVSWMHKQTLIQLQRGNGHTQPQLEVVRAAVKSCIDGVSRFWYDIQYDELRLEQEDGRILSFAMLSEGIRNMIAMTADIAWRAAVLNPHHGTDAHLLSEGTVLIDELDLHLHPAWQRRIVGDLQRTFPQLQFIVTTHSPQIVASVHRRQVRMLDRNHLVEHAPHVEGRTTNEILEDVFGVAARPDDVQTELKEMYQLIEDEAFSEARARLATLLERLGPADTDMVRAQWILDTEDPTPNAQQTAAP